MKELDIAPYLSRVSTTTYDIAGTPFSVDSISGKGRFRYYKVTAYHPTYNQEIKITFEEFFEAAPPDLQEYILFNLDLFRNKEWIEIGKQH
jgi:hypothetical protein